MWELAVEKLGRGKANERGKQTRSLSRSGTVPKARVLLVRHSVGLRTPVLQSPISEGGGGEDG